MKRQRSRFSKLALFGAISLCLACSGSAEKTLLKQGIESEEGRKFSEALSSYDKLINRAPKSEEAIEAARRAAALTLLETKEPKKSAAYLGHLVFYSRSEKERVDSQRQIAKIFFDNLNDYSRAISELHKLLPFTSGAEKSKTMLMIAKAYYYQNKLAEAEGELSGALKPGIDPEAEFDALWLRANIYLVGKRLEEAAEVFKGLMEKHPERSKTEDVGISLAFCYEEKNDFRSAIKVLETMKESYRNPEFIETKIKRLAKRESQLPGARGLRK